MSITTRQVIGWIAVGFSAVITSFWAFWGAVETFHEGWYFRDWKTNVALTLAQYLSPMLVLMVPALSGLRWPRVGAFFHFALAGMVGWYLRGLPAMLFIVAPLCLLGLLYFLGRPEPLQRAVAIVCGLPLLTMLVSGAYPAWLASDRFDSGDYGAKTIDGNGVRLVWAPEGPGWPDSGTNWHEAQSNCGHLDAHGRTLLQEPQNLWRLPTVDEAVRSAVRKGRNAGGAWNPQTSTATYAIQPNKDSPLWKKYSKIIYWWTAAEANETTAYRFVWNGQIHRAPKKARWGYLAYRCVKQERI